MPRRILVTGAAGTVGRHVLAALDGRSEVEVRGLGRRARPPELPARAEWLSADLVQAALAPAVRGVDAIVHLASAKGSDDHDEVAVRRLLAAAREAGVRHAVVISIVGCDRIPLPFYETKRRVEAAVRAGGVPWTLLRTTQFHSFVERLISVPASLPLPTPIVADLRFQPVDEREVADRLVELALGPPQGDAPELGGPELLTLGELAATWLAATGRAATLVPVPASALMDAGASPPLTPAPWTGPVLEAYRAAWNAPAGARTLGRVRFAEWLAQAVRR